MVSFESWRIRLASTYRPRARFRVEYRGRSVVISGDSNVTDATSSMKSGADLLLHDALSVPAVTSMSEGFAAEGRARISKIMVDVLDYHASLKSIIEQVVKSISVWSPTTT